MLATETMFDHDEKEVNHIIHTFILYIKCGTQLHLPCYYSIVSSWYDSFKSKFLYHFHNLILETPCITNLKVLHLKQP